jgi:hypothetical protein
MKEVSARDVTFLGCSGLVPPPLSGGGRCFYIPGSRSTHRFFFPFGGGRLLHNIQSIILCNLLGVQFAHFMNSFLSSSSDVLSLLRRSCHLVPELFIRSMPRSCCLRPRSLMLLLHSGPFQHLILDICPVRVLGATLSWSCERVPSVMPLLHGGSSLCMWWSIPSTKYNLLLAAPRGQILVPTLLPQSYDQHHCGFFLGDLLMLLYGLHHSWIRFSLGRPSSFLDWPLLLLGRW